MDNTKSVYPKYQIKIGNQIHELTSTNGKYEFTFIPTSPDDTITLYNSTMVSRGYIADDHITNIQIEENDTATGYVSSASKKTIFGEMFDDLENLKIDITSKEGKYSQSIVEMANNAIRTSVSDGVLKTIIDQTNHNISLKATKDNLISEINTQAGGVLIRAKDSSGTNKLAITPSTTYIQDGTIKSGHIGNAQIKNAHIANASIASGKIINLDVDKLTGNFARLARLLFNGRNSNVVIDSTGMKVLRRNGEHNAFFNEDGIELFRSGQTVGALRSLNAVDQTGAYKGLKSFSITTVPNAYLSLSYWSDKDKVYYRALSLGGDGYLRLDSPLYSSQTDAGFKLEKVSIGGMSGSAWLDVKSGGGVAIASNRNTYFSSPSGWHSLQKLIQDVEGLKSSVRSIRSGSTGSTNVPRDGNTARKNTSYTSGTINRGDRVRLRSGVTTYYDQNDRPVTIPTAYRTRTYTVGNVDKSWPRSSPYRLEIGGVIIAWAREGDIYKV